MTTPTCEACAGDVRTVEPCPDCDCIPADRARGFAVTVWVERVRSQEDADALVERLLAGTLDVAVVRE
jgi:hypothetical protein